MSVLYHLCCLGASAILIVWGTIDLTSGERNSGLFRIGLGVVSVIGYGAGLFRGRRQQTVISCLQARIADRTLTSDKQALFRTRLSPFAGQKVQIAVESDWDEPRMFALSLRDALAAAGWVVSMGPWNNSNRGGMTISGRNMGANGPAHALSHALTVCGVRHRTAEIDSEEIMVSIGVKE